MVPKKETEQQMGRVENAINTYSRPSELKITDMRIAVVASNYDYPIIRLDTNQASMAWARCATRDTRRTPCSSRACARARRWAACSNTR